MTNPMHKDNNNDFSSLEMMNRLSLDSEYGSAQRVDASNYSVTGASCCGPVDVLNCFPSKSQLKDKSLYNRLLLCVLAICLMWCTSLKVASTFAGVFIQTPDLKDVYSSCNRAFDVTNDQRTSYVSCVEVQLGYCYMNLQSAADREAARVEKAREDNAVVVADARQNQIQCSSSFTSTRLSLQEWAKGGSSLPYRPGCSAEDRNTIGDNVGDVSAVRSEAFGITTKYSEESDSTVGRLSDYAVIRARYDANYMDNKTQYMQDDFESFVDGINFPDVSMNVSFKTLFPNVDDLIKCVSPKRPPGGPYSHSCPLQEWGAYDYLYYSQSQYKTLMDDARANALDFYSKSQTYRANAKKAYDNSKKFLEGVHDAVKEFSVSTADWGDWYDMTLLDIYPGDVVWPSQYGDFPNLPGVDAVWEKVSPIADGFYGQMRSASRATHALGEQVQEDVEAQLKKLPSPYPEDYNPPKYVGADSDVTSVTEEKKRHKNTTKSFLDQATVALGAFDQLQQYTAENLKPPRVTFNFTHFKDQSSDFSFNFAKLHAPNVDFDLFFIQFGSVSGLLYLFDFAYRAYSSMRLLYFYWGRGSVNIPDVDLTVDQEPVNPLKMSTPRLAALIITNPMAPAFLALTFTIWGGALMSSIYMPIYHEYIDGCVNHGPNGTFVTANMYSMTYNYASEDGNTASFTGLDAYDTKRADICSQYSTHSQQNQVQDAQILESVKTSHESSSSSLALYSGCIDSVALDTQYSKACCGVLGYPACGPGGSGSVPCPLNTFLDPPSPFPLPSTTLLEPSCAVDFNTPEWVLDDAVFNCDALPSCETTCEGPDSLKLEAVTESCGCMVEWTAHSVWLNITLSIIIYVFMNLSRLGIIKGLAKIFYKGLNNGLFTYKASALRDGNFVVAFKDTVRNAKDEKRSLQILIKERLDAMLPTFKWMGVPILVLAIAFNVPWIYALKSFSYDIEYKL